MTYTTGNGADALRTRRSSNSRGRRQARTDAGQAAGQVRKGSFNHLTPFTFLARESPLYGYLLLDKMIDQTLTPYLHIPAVQVAHALKARPLARDADGEKLREELGAQLLYSRQSPRSFFGVRFVIDGHFFQYGLTSGAKTGLSGDNHWVDSVRSLVEEWRPAMLVTGPASRLARLETLFARLEEPLKTARTLVVTAETDEPIDLLTSTGKRDWDQMATFAASDYRLTVTRLLTGVVYELKNNRYPRAADHLIPGYRKVGGKGADKHAVRPSTSSADRTLVHRFIEMSASDYTDREIAAELSNLGLKSRHTASRTDDGLPRADEVGDPGRLINTLYSALPTYLDGKYPFQHEMPLPHIDTFHGFAVNRLHPRDNGYIECELDFGLPKGGWADPELIKAAIARRAPHTNAPAPASRTILKPLAGLIRWSDKSHEYCLLAKDTASYELRRRVVSKGSIRILRRTGFGPGDGELCGRFSAAVLHRAFAQLLRQLGERTPATLPCPIEPPPELNHLDDLVEARASQQVAADGARREVIRATGEEAELYREIARESQAQVAQLDVQIAQERARLRPPPGATPDGQKIAALIKILENLEGPADVAVLRALRSLVQRARIVQATPTQPVATLEAVLTIRTDVGSLTVGPLHVPIQNRAVGGKPGSDTRKAGFAQRNLSIVEILLLEGGQAEGRRELWEAEGFTPRSYTRRMHAVLEPLMGAGVASALVDCPILDVRRAALEPFLKHGLPLSADFSEDLAHEVRAVYAARGFSWTNGWCPGGMARERQVLTYIDRYAPEPDTGLPVKEVLQALALDYSSLYRMTHEGSAPYGRTRTSAAPWYARLELINGPNGPRSKGGRIRIRACAHCGQRTLLQPLRVPEVAGYLLCTNPECRRSLRSNLQYPAEFFLPWDGAQSLALRDPRAGRAEERVWFTTEGRIIRGTTLREIQVPSANAPRAAGKPRTK